MDNENGMKPTVIKKKGGGGCLVIFGLPFFLAGMCTLLGALGIVPVQVEQGQSRILLAAFGFIFTAVGAVLMFGRAGITIDLRTMKLVKWWGVGMPMKSREYNLGFFNRITVGRERRKSGNSSSTVYPVKLEGYEGVEPFEYEAPGDYQAARQTGEKLAEVLHMNLEDSSSGKAVVREPARLGESLRERLRRTGGKPEHAPQPYEMRSRVLEEDNQVSIKIPPPGLKPVSFLHLVPGLIFSSLVYFFFFRGFMNLPAPDIIHVVFAVVIVVFFILAPLLVSLGYAVDHASRGYTITVDADVIRLREKKGLRSRTVEIPLDKLEELELVQAEVNINPADYEKQRGRPLTSQEELQMQRMLDSGSFFSKFLKWISRAGIVARSDRQSIEFGKGLSSDELKYLHDVILRAVQRQ